MREWSLNSESPLALRIAADIRVSHPDYIDDQIWELTLKGGSPPAIAIQTCYGFRARALRIFAGFSLGEAVISDPTQFHTAPEVRSFLPNYLRVAFAPFADLSVQAEYWVQDSKILTGRFLLRNRGMEEKIVQFRLHAILWPDDEGERFGEWQQMGVSSLAGRTGKLAPVVFVTGGAVVEHLIYPALVVKIPIAAGSTKSLQWAHAGLGQHEASFEAARSAVSRPWEPGLARLELLNNSIVDIETGDLDWDAALSFSQMATIGSYLGSTRSLPFPSFVLTRIPERGYSHVGDGSDYNWQWDGQTAQHAYGHFINLLPIAADLAKSVIRNFLAVQRPDGTIDWKPGLGGQRNGALCVPLLATLSWKLYQRTDDSEFLKECLPALVEFMDVWNSSEHDRDGDGHPEWDHTAHMGFDDCPTFVRWQAWGQGLDITKAETPDLASYLYRECCSLLAIARTLQREDLISKMETRVEQLRQAVEATWSEEKSIYQHIDRDTHISTPGEILGSGHGEFTLEVHRVFPQPVRILIRATSKEIHTHAVQAFIYGRGRRGRHRVERLQEQHFQWFMTLGTATSEKTYMEVERIEVRGLSEAFETVISTADYTRQDISLLLPLWAGIPDPFRAEKLVRGTIMDPNRFWRPYGIAACSAQDPAYPFANPQGSGAISMLWNSMLVEGLLDYGYDQEAAELITRLMQATIRSLREEKAFREYYNAENGSGIGERDHLAGLAPVGLFLRTLGVYLISPDRMVLRGVHPFPWAVTVRWMGVVIHCFSDRKVVIFNDGARLEIEGEEFQLVERREQ